MVSCDINHLKALTLQIITLVQFQAVHEIRALHYNQLKAALPSLKFLFIEPHFSKIF